MLIPVWSGMLVKEADNVEKLMDSTSESAIFRKIHFLLSTGPSNVR